MEKACMSALVPRSIPLMIWPSIRSTKELISNTPGIRNKMLVAKACSKLVSKPRILPHNAITAEANIALP